MPWRGVAPVQLVIAFIGAVLMSCVLGMIVLAVLGRDIPQELATVAVSSMTAMGGLLAPNTGLLTSGRTARRAEAAGHAAATAVIDAELADDGPQHRADPSHGGEHRL